MSTALGGLRSFCVVQASIFLKLLSLPGVRSFNQVDPRFKRILWQLIGGTRGGPNRARIIEVLSDRPFNANQLAEHLKLDYKTVDHHLRVLALNGLIETSGAGSYASMHFLTSRMQENLGILKEILAKIGRK